MDNSIGFSIATDLPAAFHLPSEFQIIPDIIPIIVRVNKILAGVVRGVDVNELHLPGIALLQQLQHFQIIALDHQVPGRVPIHAVLRAGAQGSC